MYICVRFVRTYVLLCCVHGQLVEQRKRVIRVMMRARVARSQHEQPNADVCIYIYLCMRLCVLAFVNDYFIEI